MVNRWMYRAWCVLVNDGEDEPFDCVTLRVSYIATCVRFERENERDKAEVCDGIPLNTAKSQSPDRYPPALGIPSVFSSVSTNSHCFFHAVRVAAIEEESPLAYPSHYPAHFPQDPANNRGV